MVAVPQFLFTRSCEAYKSTLTPRASSRPSAKGLTIMDASKKLRKPPPPGFRWIFIKEFRHWRSKQMVRRKNGGYFCFLVRC